MLRGNIGYYSLFWSLVLTALFNVIDFMATLDLVVHGIHGEWNPFMRSLVGTPYFALYKLVLIPLGLVFLWFARKIVVEKYLGLVRLACGAYALLMLYTWAVFYS